MGRKLRFVCPKKRALAQAKYRCDELEKAHADLIVSLPLNAFLNSPTCELSILRKRLSECDCIPSGWTMSPEEVDILTFYRISGTDPEVSHVVKVLESLEPKISIFGKTVTVVNTSISKVSDIVSLLQSIEEVSLCPRNQEFIDLCRTRGDELHNRSGKS